MAAYLRARGAEDGRGNVVVRVENVKQHLRLSEESADVAFDKLLDQVHETLENDVEDDLEEGHGDGMDAAT